MLYSQKRFLLFINPGSKLSLFRKKREVNLESEFSNLSEITVACKNWLLITWCELIFSFSLTVRVAAWYSVRLLGWWWAQQAMCSTARPQTRSSHDQRPALCSWNRYGRGKINKAGTKVGPDQLGPPVRVGPTRIDSDQLGSSEKIKIK